jgi:hypothetical protein
MKATVHLSFSERQLIFLAAFERVKESQIKNLEEMCRARSESHNSNAGIVEQAENFLHQV